MNQSEVQMKKDEYPPHYIVLYFHIKYMLAPFTWFYMVTPPKYYGYGRCHLALLTVI